MGIDLSWEHEDGTLIESIGDPQSRLSGLVQRLDLTGTVCLRFLDPYGDTTFNQRQIPVLAAEVERVISLQADRAVRDHLQQVLDLARKASGQVHTYLKFVGD